MQIINYQIGADPELFIINEKTKKVVSAVGLIPGVKGNPYRSEDMPEGFGLEIDNILAEFNIPPCDNVNDFIKHINYMKQYIRKFVKSKDKNLNIKCSASEYVDEDQLQTPEAKLFGCSIDYNAWTEEPNPKPEGESTNLRSAGMHIHLSYNNPNIDTSIMLVKYLDLYLGVPSVLKDNDTERRKLYGKAGCFRLCNYGLEYRSLSSYMMSNVNLLRWIWKQIGKAIYAYNNDYSLPYYEDIYKAINENNKDLAQHIISNYGV